jgi:hypothetical protein
MNPLIGELITSILPTSPSEVFEADMPDLSQLSFDKAAQLAGSFGKYGSTKADPFVANMDEASAFASDPQALAMAKADSLKDMLKSYGESKAAPYLDSINALQAKLPESSRLPLANIEELNGLVSANLPETITKSIPPITSFNELPNLTKEMMSEYTPVDGLEIAFMDEIGQPLAGQQYEVLTAKGEVLTGTTDQNGLAKLAPNMPGPFALNLPSMDKSAW